MSYDWRFSTPEAEGMDSDVLNQVDDYIKQKQYRLVNSVLVVKNGNIVFEHYYNKFNEKSRNNTKSIGKSILSIVTGICLDKGIIHSLDEPISKYIREFAMNRHPYHKLITVRHLLTMTSGIYWNGGVHYHCPMLTQMMRTNDWMSHLSDIAMNSVPGRQYQYKEWDVILLSAMIGNAYGGTAYDATKEFLYEPLDIASGIWPQSPCGHSYTVMEGEEESDLCARDLAKIGMLFLDNGTFNGNRIISREYVMQAVNPTDTNASYGYLWRLFADGFGCRGYGGQEINVIPESNFISIIQATVTRSNKSYGDINDTILKKAIL